MVHSAVFYKHRKPAKRGSTTKLWMVLYRIFRLKMLYNNTANSILSIRFSENPRFSCISRRPAAIKSSVFPYFCPYKPKRGQRLYYFQALPFESEIHPLHNSVDLCRGHFVHTLNNEAEAKRRNDARRQQTRPRSHDYDRGR